MNILSKDKMIMIVYNICKKNLVGHAEAKPEGEDKILLIFTFSKWKEKIYLPCPPYFI